MSKKNVPVGLLFSNSDLRRLIIPLIVENLLAISVGMFDTMMVSSLGEEAVSGVSLVDMISVLMIHIFSALATGGAVVCAHSIGHLRVSDCKKDYRDVRLAAKHLMFILIFISILIGILSFFFRAEILNIAFGKIEKKAMAAADVYLAVSAFSYPFIAIYNGFAALFRTIGNSKVTMYSAIIMNIVNLIGNAVFIYVLKFDVFGAALSTLIARFVGMIILFILILDKRNVIYIDFKEKFSFSLKIIRKILAIGIPGGFENGVFTFGRIIVVSLISGFGTVQVAANAVANNLDKLGVIPGTSIGLAVVTVIGQCIGAGDFDAVRYYLKKLIKWSYLCMAVFNTFLILTLPLTLSLYDLSYETIKLATLLIIIHNGFGILLWTASFVTPHALRAAKDVNYTMIVSISSMFIFRILLSHIIGVKFGYGIIGVWIAMVFDWIFRSVMFVSRVCGKKWLKKVFS